MSKSIVGALAAAVLEWMIIIMLLINASFGYLIALFAQRYELQSPCLVCSRLDDLLGRKKWKFYTNLICTSHRSEISSLVLCRAHNNLANVLLMCDNCVSSFATTSKSNAETYRLLVDQEQVRSFSGHTKCSCCNEPLFPRQHTDAPTRDGVPSYCQKENDCSLKKRVGWSDPLSQVEYSKLEINPADDNKASTTALHGLERISCPPRCSHDTTTSITSDLDDVLAASEESPVEGLKEKPSIILDGTSTLSHTSSSSSKDIIAFDSSTPKTRSMAPESPSLSKLSSLADVLPSKLAVGDRGRRLSSALAEQWLAKDPSRTSEDTKQLLSQLSATRDPSMSPRVLMSPKILPSSSPKIATTPKPSLNRISLERSESNLSVDGSIVPEIEGETLVDRLKRQIEHDRKLLAALYEELEVERNASAIAANQALAMINRLQEEKASLHMEALQCLRMMEEQAEFDMEALDKTNGLLADREKEIQDLEAELEYYRGDDETMLDSALAEDQVFGSAESHETFYSVDGSPQSTRSTQSN